LARRRTPPSARYPRPPPPLHFAAGRYQVKRFRKALCPIVERLCNALMRKGREKRKTVIDAFASTLPNVYVVGADDVRPEEKFGYPSVGQSIESLSADDVALCARREIEWVMVHSNTADHVVLEIAAEMVSGKRKRISFAPMVWMTGCLMAYEAVRVILQKPGGPGVGGVFFNPWTSRSEHNKSAPVAALRRSFVRRFLDKMTGA
jgi:hypothetical protein